MRHFLYIIAISLLLTACGDDDIYGVYKNPQQGLIIKIAEKSIKFPGGNLTVSSWDVNKDTKTYTAHTFFKISEQSNFKKDVEIEKTSKGVIIDGIKFEKE
ncbi:hypothetical protein [Enterobacter sp. Bisph1]|uniref:hypothetical protein n=1 Tax=Enterobacter sp. Bisph1 TaxID=1274399 RepID=UPI00057BF983|nr:hypothetical protein [Enterobacter sp. Bisph1]